MADVPFLSAALKPSLAKVALTATQPLLTASNMQTVGEIVTALMQERIESGQTADGKPLKPYDTKPIYIPKEGIGSTAVNKLKPKGGRATKKSVFYQGGYAEFKRLSGKSGGKPDLTASGAVVREIKVRAVAPELFSAEFRQREVIQQIEKREGASVFSLAIAEQNAAFDTVQSFANLNLLGMASNKTEALALLAANLLTPQGFRGIL